jgi:DnaJ homolog subfamily C member 28
MTSSVEKQIREAMEAGAFDNLPGKGKPIDMSENPFEDPDLRTAHRLLRDAGFAPPFIEERKAIDAELEQARTRLNRAWKIYQSRGNEGQTTWERVMGEFRELAAGLNSRIRVHNLKVPSGVFQRNLIDVDQEIKRAQTSND